MADVSYVTQDMWDAAQAELTVLRARNHELFTALRALMTNPHIDLGDQVYEVREREGEGWDGPSVKAWSVAVQAAKNIVGPAVSASAEPK